MGHFRSSNSRNNVNLGTGGSDGPLDLLFNSSEQETANISERNDGALNDAVTDEYSFATEGEESGTGCYNKK